MAEVQAVQESARSLLIATLEFIARSLVEYPDDVKVDADDSGRSIVLRLRVHPDDMGRVIGKRGHTARAIRSVVKAAAAKCDVHAIIEIVE